MMMKRRAKKEIEERPDRCHFCDTLSQYHFGMQIAVCAHHWDEMYHQDVPDYVDDTQIYTYKRLALEKKLWKK